MTVKVGVNGYGTIGRRVADAISKQPDMKLMGVVKTKPDYKASLAVKKGYKVYAASEKEFKAFEKAGVKAEGILADLIREVDIIVDATPGDVGAQYKPTYVAAGLPTIFQGGEEAEVAEASFVAQCNYDRAVGLRYIRCVSCNTTGLCRTLNALNESFGIRRARATVIRRATDPDDIKRGPIDAIVPDPTELPSHHGPDVNTVLPHVPITTVAVKVPTTYMHIHALCVSLKSNAKREDVVEVFQRTPRVMLIDGKSGLGSTAHLFDLAREMGRPREDLYEIAVWRESVSIVDDEVYYLQAVDQEADVVPENIDAIRASLKLMDRDASMRTTDKTLGIAQ
ncbi:MAG: type II glyceraldehyde-3-phosphate dehydrogenase [Candidatus Bathyarchaeia archaeon]